MPLSSIVGLLLLLTCSVRLISGDSDASASTGIVFRQPVVVGFDHIGDINIHDGDEPADAVFAFGEKHHLNEAQRLELLDLICASVMCNRRQAIIWQTEISAGNDFSGRFCILEAQEPADAAHAFVRRHNLTLGYRNAILSEACKVLACTRAEPIVWRKSIYLQGLGSEVEVAVLEGQEPADVIYNVLKPYDVSFRDRQRVMEVAKKEGAVYSRDHALVFSEEIQIGGEDNSNITIPFQLYDDGKEPIDSLYLFTLEHGTDDDFNQVAASVMSRICQSSIGCQRMRPIVWKSQPIATANGRILGSFGVLRKEEPIDAVDHFAQIHGLDDEYCRSILEMVCSELPCNRMVPIVWRKTINDENGNALGSLTVLEDEEVADAAHRFLNEFTFPLDRGGLKNYFFQNACVHPRVKCTRLVANVYDRNVSFNNGTAIGWLTIRENQEPADAIYEWSKTHDLSEDQDFVFSLIEEVCQEKGVTCRRDAPLVKSIPLSGPDGNHVGVFELKLKQEPIDALYGFFSRHGLFTQKWDIKLVLAQLCAIDGIKCSRTEAIKFHADNFNMGGKSIGPLTIGEDEEVIDVMYRKRLNLNLTVEDQMESFTNICKDTDIYCARTRAVVYSMCNISALDYARFGNETCQRKYAGVQFLAAFADSIVGGRIASILKHDGVAATIEHPLFGPVLLNTVLLCVKLILFLVERRMKRRKLSTGIYAVAYLYTFIAFCVLFSLFIEPTDDIDLAVHLQEGRLPDLHILEGEEAADAVLKWGKEAARKHHPIVRQSIHWEILDKICVEAENVTCTRRRAWEAIDMGVITLFGNPHDIEYLNPAVDPDASDMCKPIFDGEADTCLQRAAQNLCRRLHPLPPGCVKDITMHMSRQLIHYDKGRLDSKNTYRKLNLEMDAPDKELFGKMSQIVKEKKVNLAPFSRVDNGTVAAYDSWDKHTLEAWAAVDAFGKIKDPESRDWNDKPCEPLFGGVLCAKHDKDGNLMIEV